ncbi:TolC family protein [Sphingobacterium sp. DR205]|uniref:TolC family protein n=1 Tax=Sphingobacterium sp. DR205 TaxID=2713573 RepID=UPI0013E43A6E|nr:TolC family protein [Sphingobacterium sp. DR205]QIH35934.1 TolC family protein [Sphingobacterium sp. DR205]
MKYKLSFIGVLIVFFVMPFDLSAQSVQEYSLQQLLDTAKKTNDMLIIKEYAVDQSISKLRENKIKRYPSVMVDGSYQYNFNLPAFTVPAGTLGSVPIADGTSQLLPQQDSHFKVGDKGVYSLNLGVYQPVLQQLKMGTGQAIDVLDIKIGQLEKQKTWLQVGIAIEQQYYLALMAKKQIEVSNAKVALAKAKFNDGNNASSAGKIISKDMTGLKILIDAEQLNMLKLESQYKDCLSILGELTNIDPAKIELAEKSSYKRGETLDWYRTSMDNSPDLKIAQLDIEKAALGVKAARQSKLPDLGVLGGYSVQKGNPILPEQTPYIGVSLKWNLQNLFSGKEMENQRLMQLKQAETKLKLVKDQLSASLDRAWRKVTITSASIATAENRVEYCRDALKYQQDKMTAGMNTGSELLQKRVELSEAESLLYQALAESLLARAELDNMIGSSK